MNEAAFLINIKKCKTILNEYNLLKKVNLKNIQLLSYSKYSDIFRKKARQGDYERIYITGIEMDDYDFLLQDGSYFQFSYDKNESDFVLRMAFYPTINEISYVDFLHEFLEMDIDECGSTFIEDYQQFLTEQEVTRVTPVRYDYNSKIYRPLVHSSSHIHFGYEENIRIPIDGILLPSAFVKVILQYFYYDSWKEKVLHEEGQDLYIGNGEKEKINGKFWGENEKKLPHIHLESF